MSRLRGDSTVYWMIGDPIAQVKLPGLINAWFDSNRVNAALVPLHVAPKDLEAALQVYAAAANVPGLLSTLPHKVDLAQKTQILSDRSRALGVVNTLKKEGGVLVGDIFDGVGVVQALRAQGQHWTGDVVLMIGCGGLGRAAAWELLATGARRVELIDSDPQRATDLAAWLAHQFGAACAVAVADPSADVAMAVNASPLGMRADDLLPLALGVLARLPALRVVVDAVTGEQTPWLQAASGLGLNCVNGEAIAQSQMASVLAFWGCSV